MNDTCMPRLIREKIQAGVIHACGLAGCPSMPANVALNEHVFGPHGVGVEAATIALHVAGFDPPQDPSWFNAALACNLLGL